MSDPLFYAIVGAAWLHTAAAVVAAFSKTMIPLRVGSVIANILGVAVGAASANAPVFLRHLILLPLDLIRLREMRRLIASVRRAADGELNVEWLKPFMHPAALRDGAVLFRRGEAADQAFMLIEGEIELVELGAVLQPGTLFGEMALFTQSGARTATAQARGDCRLLAITYDQFEQLYFQNPRFGLYLVRLMVRRYESNLQRLEDARTPQPKNP
jgi:CRP/FNR family transcriptional regulator, cyclic AMP receptor protein